MILQNLVLSMVDLGVRENSKIKTLSKKTKVFNFTLNLSSKRSVELKSIIQNGPLLLIFIRGTWCPFCRLHLGKLRDWAKKLENSNTTIIVVSSESNDEINKWLSKNPSTYLFASDPKGELGDYFGVRISPNTFMQAATFIIDKNFEVQLAYKGRRNNSNLSAVLDVLKVS